jgi:hypothetical protein
MQMDTTKVDFVAKMVTSVLIASENIEEAKRDDIEKMIRGALIDAKARLYEKQNEKLEEWLDRCEMKEINKLTLHALPDYNWTCKSCGASGTHHDAMTMKMKLSNHRSCDMRISYDPPYRR